MSRFMDTRLQGLSPYVPGEQLRKKDIIKLNTNENPYPPSPKVLEVVGSEAHTLHLYPDVSGGNLVTQLASFYKVDKDQVFFGNGSDEILAFCFQAFCPQGVAFADLTYGFYPVYAQLYQVPATVIPLREDLSLGAEDYYDLHKTIVIANPNAPTGLALSLAEIQEILRRNQDALVIVDEAYVDFGAQSCVTLLDQNPNLLVVGTFSKSRSMAGARLGYALGSKELIADLNTIKFSFNPYNVNQLTLAAGAASLEDQAYFEQCRDKVVETRESCKASFAKMGFSVTDSKANFLFVSHPKYTAESLYQQLKQRDILVRWFCVPRIENYLRITVGTQQQMDRLLAALQSLIEQ